MRNTLSGVDLVDHLPLTASVLVPTIPLDDVLAQPCDLLKIDCEGAEFDLFRAEPSLLRQADRMIGELHPGAGDVIEALDHLKAAVFVVSVTQEPLPHFTALRR